MIITIMRKSTARCSFSGGVLLASLGVLVPTALSFSVQSNLFSEKLALENRLADLERTAALTLQGFYEPHLKSFSVQPTRTNSLSVTSTCFALQAILNGNDKAYEGLLELNMKCQTSDQPHARQVLVALLASNWRKDDMFQVPLLLSTLLKVDTHKDLIKTHSLKVRQLVEAVLDARPRRRYGTGQSFSDYIVFQCAEAYAALFKFKEVSTTNTTTNYNLLDAILPENATSSLALSLVRCVEVSSNELCRQLAYKIAGDDSAFDVMRLAYSLLTYITATESLSETAGLELVQGQGPSPGTRVEPLNPRLVRAAVKVFFEVQRDNGMWDRGQPIYKSFRRQGVNIGNAFIFSVDTLGTLLRTLPASEFRPYLPQLEKTLEWIEQHQRVDVIADYCDPVTGQCYGRTLRGWTSPHLSSDTGPQAWSTAQVLGCVSDMRRVTRELMHDDVLQEFKGVRYSSQGSVATYWDRLLDSDIGDAESELTRTLKGVLEERVVHPFLFPNSSPAIGAVYSSILFGPPGTAKTTICESLAQKLGWDFVVIDTAVFLADGLANVASRIRYVFERLERLDKCIILFDEIEEFCLDRETRGIGMESRMLTTAMLTAINDLRRAKRSVFFLATNRLKAFDSAITRPGRFDMQLFVGPPNLGSKKLQFKQQLTSVQVDDKSKEQAMAMYGDFLAANWEDTAMFMNYLEGLQFAKACASVLSVQGQLREEELERLLKTQAAVMTVRGQARAEFQASINLSRL